MLPRIIINIIIITDIIIPNPWVHKRRHKTTTHHCTHPSKCDYAETTLKLTFAEGVGGSNKVLANPFPPPEFLIPFLSCYTSSSCACLFVRVIL